MIKKLLLFVRSLFLNFSTSSKERSFNPSLRMLCLGMFFISTLGYTQTTWTGAVSADWSNAGNWTAGVPDGTDAVTIPNVLTNKPIISAAGATCSSLTIRNASTDLGNGNNTLTINSPGTLVTGVITITSPTANTRNTIINVASGTLTGSAITMDTSTANSRDNSLRIGTGIVNITGDIAMGTDSNRSDITFSGSGTINVGGTISGGGTFTAGTGLVNYNNLGVQNIGTYTYNNLTISGSGTKTLLASTTANGALNVKANTTLALSTFNISTPNNVALECGAVTGSIISGTGTLTLGGTVSVTDVATGTNGAAISCPVALGGNRIFTVADDGTSAIDLTISGSVSGAFSVTKAGAGTMNLSGANAYSAATTVSAGILQLGSTTALGITTSTTVSSGASLDLNGFTLSSARPLTLNGTGISSGGALTNSSASATTYSGLITLGSASSIIANSGSIAISNAGTISGATFGLTLGGSGNGSVTSIIGNTTGGVAKSGLGTWTLSGVNTYTGATSVNSGTLKLGNTSGLGTTAGATTIISGAVLDLNGFNLGAEPLTINGTGLTSSPAGALTNTGGNASFGGAITLGSASTITATSSGTLTCSGAIGTGAFGLTLDGSTGSSGTISGVISSPTSLNKNGLGTWTLSGTNTYTGTTSVNAGTLSLGTAEVFYGNLAITSGASVVTNNNAVTFQGDFTNNGTFTAGSSAITISSPALQSISGFSTTGSVTMSKTTGAIATLTGSVNARNLTIDGSGGRLSLGTGLTHTFTGDWIRNQGTLNGGSSTLKIGGNVTGTGSTFTPETSTVEFNGGNQNLGSAAITYNNLTLSGSGSPTKTFAAITTASDTWTINSGVKASLGGITSHGAKTVVLAGLGTYITGSCGSALSGASNTSDVYFTAGAGTGRINLISLIDSNYAYYSNSTADLFASVGENTGPLTLTAPDGFVFINTKFASYGTPLGTAPNYKIGGCHVVNSRSITTGLLGNTTATIPGGAMSFNGAFGDPCSGTIKTYSVVATYALPICSSAASGIVITGSTPTGGNGSYTYLWEQSSSVSSGYTTVGTAKDYTTGTLPVGTTYFRRTVTSGIYTDATIVVVPVISAPTTAPTVTSSCSTLTASPSSVAGTYVEWFSGTCGTAVVGTGLSYNPTSTGNHYARYRNICGPGASCSTVNSVSTTSNTVSITPTSPISICSGTSGNSTVNLPYTSTGTSGTSTYSIIWSPNGYLIDVFDRVLPGSTIVLDVPDNAPAGTYTGTIKVKTSSCVSAPKTFTLTIGKVAGSASSTATLCINTPLTAITHATTNATGIGTPTGLPAGVTATWLSNVITISGTPTASGTFAYTIPLTGSCIGSADATGTINVNQKSADPASASAGSGTICIGDSTTLTLNGGGGGTGETIKWYTGSCGGTSVGSGNGLSVSPTVTTTYYGRYEDGTPCNYNSACSSVTITVNQKSSNPTSASAGSATICNGDSTTLTLNGGGGGTGTTIKWYMDSCGGTSVGTGNGLSVSPTVTTIYYGRYEDGTPCNYNSACSSVTVTVNQKSADPASVSAGSSTICNGESTTLTLNGGGGGTGETIKWYTGSCGGTSVGSGNGLSVSPTVTTTYYGRYEDGTPCNYNSACSSLTVTVNQKSGNPTSASASSAIICNGESTTLTLNGGGGGTGASIKWYTVSCGGTSVGSGNGLSVSPTGTTTYYGRYEDGTPCSSNTTCSSVTVTVNPLPTILTQPQPLALCENQNGSFTVSTSAASPTYFWEYSTSTSGPWLTTDNIPNVSGYNTSTLLLTTTPLNYGGNYVRCTVTSGGCSITSNVVGLIVNPIPTTPTVSVTTQPTCAVPTGTITVSSPAPGPGITYSINGTDYFPTAVFNNVAPNIYSVTTKNSAGCPSPAITVTVYNATKEWNGSIDNDWTKAGNWTPNIVPTNADCVVIPTTVTQPEIVAGSAVEIYSINVGSGGLLTVNSKAILTVVSGITVASDGNLVFEDDSSLLQKSTDNTINSGNITYKRITAKVSRYDFTFWSSPVTRTPLAYTLADVSPLTLADKYYSYIPGTGWKISYSGILPMEPGMGYIIRAPQTYPIAKISAQTYEASFIGKPNNGTIEITPLKDESIMVGNPYPSALNAREFIEYNELVRNIQVGSLYFWTHNSPPSASTPGDYKYNYTTSDYAVYNLTGSTTGASTLPNNDPPSGFIAAGAAFFIGPNSSDKIAFTNDMRVGTDNDQFFKTAKAKDEGKNRLWLNMTNEQGAFKQTLIGYVDGATNSWDYNYDGETLDGNSYLDFYSINETNKLTIQGRALPFSDTDLIPLGYISSIAGDFTISIDKGDGLFDTQAVYLEDKTTGKTVDLRAANYTFTTAKGTFEDRFVLAYTNKTLGTGDFENVENGLLVSVKNKTIKVTSAKETIKEVTIFDVNGKLLYDKKKVGSTELQVSNLQSANQVLLVKVVLENGFTTTRKIIFQ